MLFVNKKNIRVALCWATAAFAVTTIVLAVQKPKLTADLNESKIKLDYMEALLQGEVKPRMARSINTLHNNDFVQNADDDDEDPINYRLPSALKPTEYDLYLFPDISTGKFTGQELIDIDVVETTSEIVLHSLKLNIENVYVKGHQDDNIDLESWHLETLREFLIVKMVKPLEKGARIRLGIIFNGEMLNKIVGLYSSSYSTADGERRSIATSKFEPTYARQAFPCFDEPAMKAKFKVTLVHPTNGGYHALSNMNEDSSSVQNEYTEVYFDKSVAMSTYLACFIVSDFAFNTATVNTNGIGENFNIRIFATSHQLQKVNFALSVAVSVTEFYIKYFQVEYPLPKLDMAAIPDFSSNAMEHWGLLTYRETALLNDASFSSTWNTQRTAAVIAHELAHMWFGNLVTMMWWNDLWLNEGFARYMEYKGVNEVYPAWGMPDQFLLHALHPVMKYDSSVASHPIIQTVENPDQITEIFDTISYEKGASIIRMLEYTVSAENFALACTNYLTKFKYGNAITADFIKEVANLEGVGFDVEIFMATWTEQMGFPIVEVKRVSPTLVTLTQKRFFSNIQDYENSYDDSKFKYKWQVPLTFYTDKSSVVEGLWLEYFVDSTGLTVSADVKWLKFNVGQVGYYRVNYEESMWRDIIADLQAQPAKFNIADRAHLINDAFSIADASQLEYNIALDLTKYLEKEHDFVPWYVAATKLQSLQNSLMYTETYKDYLEYARGLIKKVYAEVTWTVAAVDGHLKNRLRVTILTAACSLGLSDCLNDALQHFNVWLEKPTEKPHPDLREIVYYYGMQQSKEKQWEQMWKIFIAEQDASEKTKLMYGLSAVRIPWLLHQYIELAANEQNIRRQDYFTCIQNIAANPVGESIVWEYVRENWPNLVERFGMNDRYLGRMIPAITERFAFTTKLEEMTEFFKKYPEAGAGAASRKQAVETVKYNINWLQHNADKISNWLKSSKSI